MNIEVCYELILIYFTHFDHFSNVFFYIVINDNLPLNFYNKIITILYQTML